MDNWTRLNIFALIFLTASLTVIGIQTQATSAPSRGTTVEPGWSQSCTFNIFLDGTTPVAHPGNGGANTVGTIGQDFGLFINTLIASNRVLCIEPATYTYSTAIQFGSVTNVWLRGSGQEATILRINVSPGNAIAMNIGNSANSFITISDLTIYVAFTGAAWNGITMSQGSGTDYLFKNIHFKGDGWTTGVWTAINLSPTANGDVKRVTVEGCYFENTSTTQIGDGLLFRGTWDVKVIGNFWRNMNNQIVPDNASPKQGLVYAYNMESIDITTIDAEGPDIMAWSNVVYIGNTQRIVSGIATARSTGGVLIDTGGGFGSNNWTMTGNVFMRNPIQLVPRTGVGNTVSNILISDNLVYGAPGATVPQINLYDDPNSGTANVTVTNNLLFGTGAGVRIPTGYTNLVVRMNQGYRTENWGATSVADGGTISHSLATTPTLVTVTCSIASQICGVTARAATTFTVSIKTDTGAAGTTQTVYWYAVFIP